MRTVSEINHRIADAYDFSTWDYDAPPGVEPSRLQAFAEPFGGRRELRDVLDLGCGTGRLLRDLGVQCSGRIVGTDISGTSCAKAREEVAAFGSRAEIIQADLMDLEPGRLGDFDLIYCLGTIFIVPPPARDHLAKLISGCLRPGGIAVISYYTGLGAAVRAHIARTLRAATIELQNPQARANCARKMFDELRAAANIPSHYSLAMRAAAFHIDHASDDGFFAELLNEASESISTAELNESFTQYGVEFAGYLDHLGFEPWFSSRDRALLADKVDLVSSGFRFAVFVKPDGERPSAPAGKAAVPGPGELPFEMIRALPLRAKIRRLARSIFWRIFRI